MSKYSLQKLDEHNDKSAIPNELHGKDYHIELIKRTLNPYLYDIIPKIGKNNREVSFNSQDPKINNCLLIKVKNYSSLDNVAMACLSTRDKIMSIDKIYIARMFRRSPNLELNIMRGLSLYIFSRNQHISAISISINPDIYINIVDVLLDIGYGISTEMEQKDQSKVKNRNKNSEFKANPSNKIMNVPDLSRFIESKSTFLNKPLFEVEKKDTYKESLIYLRLYRREFSNSNQRYRKLISFPNVNAGNYYADRCITFVKNW